MPSVVVASPAEREPVVGTVVAAFREDPAWAYICSAEYERVAPLFAGALFDARVADEAIWIAPDAAAVAMWDVPETASDHTELWADFRRDAGEEVWERLELYGAALSKCRPSESYWYLGVLATDQARRNQGLASAVIGPALRQADEAGLKACLETSTSKNKRFYANRGFAEVAEVDVPGGPETWWLTRHPE